MSDNLKVKVNDSYEFDLTKDIISKVDAISSSSDEYHIIKDTTSYKATFLNADFNKKRYTVKVNNNTYEVVISNALDLLIESMGFSVNGSSQVEAIYAPMPGLLLDMSVSVGQEVKKDDPLFILEAMKMENSIVSPRDGVIKSINGSKGDAVEKDQLIVEFE